MERGQIIKNDEGDIEISKGRCPTFSGESCLMEGGRRGKARAGKHYLFFQESVEHRESERVGRSLNKGGLVRKRLVRRGSLWRGDTTVSTFKGDQ